MITDICKGNKPDEWSFVYKWELFNVVLYMVNASKSNGANGPGVRTPGLKDRVH